MAPAPDPIPNSIPAGDQSARRALRPLAAGLIVLGALAWAPWVVTLVTKPAGLDSVFKDYWWFFGWAVVIVGLGIGLFFTYSARLFNVAWLGCLAGLFGVLCPLFLVLLGRLGVFGAVKVIVPLAGWFWWLSGCFGAMVVGLALGVRAVNRLDPEPAGLFGRAVKGFNFIEENSVVWVLLILALIKFVDVIGRKLLGESFAWFNEISHLSVVYMVFLGASLGVKYGVHFTMDLAVNNLPGRTAEVVQAVMNLASGIMFAIIVWAAVRYGFQVMDWGNQTPIFKINKAWGYFLLAFLSLNISIRFLMVAWRHTASVARISAAPGDPGV
ncbi:MAG: TRAP transporter small permease subunit [Proteobacteria bacterium]|nr:TRAP transporter small permease subunit [Pseudomonadota bacterium]MBU1740422.1 TRAP transporter small permease subunit [Pseudomonadota bacterium]